MRFGLVRKYFTQQIITIPKVNYNTCKDNGNSIDNNIEKIRDNEIEKIKSTLEEINKKIEDYPNSMHEIKFRLRNIEHIVNKILKEQTRSNSKQNNTGFDKFE